MRTLLLEGLPRDDLAATAVTIGVFDGVHLGHRALIRRVVAEARARALASLVLTFDPHPAAYFAPEQVPAELCSADHRRALVASEGVDALVALRFDERLAALDPAAYVDEILLRRLGARLICVGRNFTFASGRSGNAEALVELGAARGIEVVVVESVRMGRGGGVVSSTRVRAALSRGHVTEAASLLGRRHVVGGPIVRGRRLARQMGFPTINLRLERGMLPAPGIYSGLVRLGGETYPGAVYIRDRESDPGDRATVEAHLQGFSGDAADGEAGIAFLHYLRRDLRFEDEAALRQRIERDCRRSWRDAERFAEDDGGLPVVWGE